MPDLQLHRDTIIAAVLAALDEHDVIGLRGMDEPAEIGEVLPPSRVWADNEPTEHLLNGTSAVRVILHERGADDPDAAVDAAIRLAAAYPYEHWVVIGSTHYSYGEDEGEVVMVDPVVVAALPRVPLGV